MRKIKTILAGLVFVAGCNAGGVYVAGSDAGPTCALSSDAKFCVSLCVYDHEAALKVAADRCPNAPHDPCIDCN